MSTASEATAHPSEAPVHRPMGKILSNLVRSCSIYAIAILAQKVASIFLLPVYTRYLSPSDYAVMELLELAVTVFGVLLGSNFSAGFLYHYFRTDDEADRRATMSTAMFGSLAVGCAISAIGMMAAPLLGRLIFETTAYTGLMRLVFTSFSVLLMIETAYQYLRAKDYAWMYVSMSVGSLFLSVAANLILVVALGWGIAGVLTGTLIVNVITAAILLVFCLRHSGISFRGPLAVEMLRYAAPVGIAGLSIFVLNFSDRFILKRYVSTTDLGIYSMAAKFAMMLSYVTVIFNSYWNAQMYALIRGEGGPAIYSRMLSYYMAALTYAAVLLIAATDPAIHILTTSAFWSSVQFIPWLVLAFLIRCLSDYFRQILYLRARTGADATVVWASAVASITTSFVLIPRIEIWGAVAAAVVGYASLAVFAYIKGRSLMPFHLEKRRLASIAVCGIAVCIFLQIVRMPAISMKIVMVGIAAVAYPAALILTGFLNEEERLKVQTLWNKFRVGRFGTVTTSVE